MFVPWMVMAYFVAWVVLCVSHLGMLRTVQRPGVYSASYDTVPGGTVHYKELLKSFEIRVGHSPGFGLPSVAILP